ncbi:MAG: hypothetical protein QXR65_08645, partial [Candidatus Bathyarchaeia archaeon]
MKMMEELTLVDPLTFEIKKVPYRDSWKQYTYRFLNEAVQEIRGELKGKDDVGKLKIICDYLVEELPRSYWSEIPAQNSFPGFFSSLADHAIATSTICVALAVECRLEG